MEDAGKAVPQNALIDERELEEFKRWKSQKTVKDGRALSELDERAAARGPAVELRLTPTVRGPKLVPEYLGYADSQAELLLMNSLKMTEIAALRGFLEHLGELCRHDLDIKVDEANYALAMIRAEQPRNESELMVICAMVETDLMRRTLLRQFSDTKLIRDEDKELVLRRQTAILRNIKDLDRTKALLMETLKRWRTGGEQKVVVQHQHVSVGEGAQAIIGQVHAGGKTTSTRAKRKPATGARAAQPVHSGPVLTYRAEQPMRMIEGRKEADLATRAKAKSARRDELSKRQAQ